MTTILYFLLISLMIGMHNAENNHDVNGCGMLFEFDLQE